MAWWETEMTNTNTPLPATASVSTVVEGTKEYLNKPRSGSTLDLWSRAPGSKDSNKDQC